MAISEIFNFVQIDDQIITSGQPTEEQFADVKAGGYEVVINLAPHGAKNSIEDEPAVLQSLGLEYQHIPIPFDDPQRAHYEAFCAAMEKVGNRKVLVHCAANFRVSAMVSSYAVKHMGWTLEQADALVEKLWTSVPGYEMVPVWQAFIDKARS